jgi:septum formation protein
VLLLASESPQRAAILRRLEIPFVTRPTHVPELAEGRPEEVARENALRKARAARPDGEELVLGCDTLVALAGVIYGKPTDERAARTTLGALSGVTHEVISGLALLGPGNAERVAVERTKVAFRELSEGLVDWYLATGEWRGRAGGYAIQGAGAALVREIEGDYENVVGLPVATLLDLAPELIAR